jgi:hypothetical protein
MNITVQVSLSEKDRFAMTSEEAAAQVLLALNGDKDKDVCTVTVQMPTASVGTPDFVPLPPVSSEPVI